MNREKKALIALLCGNGIFGFSFMFSRLALQYTIPGVLIAVRFSIALLVLSCVVMIGKNMKKEDGTPLVSFSLKGKPKKDLLLLALFEPVIYFIAENYGILYTSSSFAGVLISVVPIMGILLDMLFMHSKISRKQVICAIVSVVGVAVTTIGADDMTVSLKGFLFLVVAVLSAAFFVMYSHKSGEHYNAIERTWMMFAAGAVFYVLLALIQCFGAYDRYFLAAFEQPVFWGSIAYLAVVSSVGAFLCLNYGSGIISVSQTTLFANITTVISILAGVLILHESFTIQQVIGAVMILGSVYLAQ